MRSTSGVGALQREQLVQRADQGASATTTQIATSAPAATRASACVYLGCWSLPQTQGAPTNDTQSTRLLRVKSLRLSNDLVCQGIADGCPIGHGLSLRCPFALHSDAYAPRQADSPIGD